MGVVSDQELPEGSEDRVSDARPKPAALRPARPDPEELELGRPDYMPKIPWRFLLMGVSIAAIVWAGYQYRDSERVSDMRQQVIRSHEVSLAPIVERYRSFRSRIERFVTTASEAGEPVTFVDPRLRISGLHGGDGLYLRIQRSAAGTPATIEDAARAMRDDAITRCLGIAPSSARGLYESGAFLMPAWLEEVETSQDYMRLRVLDEELARHASVDVPVVSMLLRSQYFLLVLENGENRRDAPVDVYLWDLRQDEPLLRTRIQANGVLIPVRIGAMLPGVNPPPAPGRPSMTSGGAWDCSIAAQIKAMTGEPALEVRSGARLAEAETAANAAAAAAAEAAPTEATRTEAAPTEATPTEATPTEATPAH